MYSTVLSIANGSCLKIKVNSCEFGKDKMELLGHVVDKNGFCFDLERVEVICATPRPPPKKELRIFLRIAGCYRHFIQSFAIISSPLHGSMPVKSKFAWTSEM